MPNRHARATRAAVIVASLLAVTAPALQAQVVPAKNAQAARATPSVVKHTVKPGDTLWDIAKFYLKDPFRWPEVFHANTDIVKNPHWIYPGQVLTIDGSAVKPEVAARVDSTGFVVAQIQTRAQAPTVFAEHQSTVDERLAAATAMPPALTVRPGEYEAAPYVVSENGRLEAGRVIGPVDRPALGLSSDAGFRLFDRVYVSIPAGVNVGDKVVVAKTGETIADVGRVIEPTAVMRIDSLAGTSQAIGTIVKQFGTVVPGQRIVLPGRTFESTSTRPLAGSYPLSAKLVWVQGSPRLPSVQTYVILAVGEAKGVRPGDQFTLLSDGQFSDGTPAPLSATARVTIVRVTPFGASGIVVHQDQPEIQTGMAARLTAKMP
ncbi:MAG: LysM peptidoglycan-binding domain-containing protein [Gemmatimonadota bacterium]